MRTLALVAVVFLGHVAGSVSGIRRDSAPAPAAPAAAGVPLDAAEIRHTPALPPATLTEVVRHYCVICHNDQLLTGNLSLATFDVENAADRAETAERMIRKLRAGMMPPPGAPRPAPDTLVALVETLESGIDRAAVAAPNLGERRFTRLTRAEYERVIRDLLALEVDANRWLPPDVLVGAFDNTAASQALSTTLLDSFVRAATDVSRLAVGNPEAPSATTKYRNRIEVSQHAWDHIEGTPFGTRGGMVVTHDFPADGEYVLQVETDMGSGNLTPIEDLELSIDGEHVAQLMLEYDAGSRMRSYRAGRAIPNIQTEPIFVRAGQRQVSAAFVNLIEGPYEDRLSPPQWSHAGLRGGQDGITGLTHLTELMITGPLNVAGVSETASRQKIFSCRPASAAEERPCAEAILSELGTRAYRRPVTAEDVADLMTFYDEWSAEGGFEVGVRMGLQAILMSPEFLFRFEREPEGIEPGQGYRLSDLELATRLSFFLWAAAPDRELLDLAARGRLSEPTVLERQVARMMEDPRSEALASRFIHQWLRLQDVGKVWPDSYFYPGFSAQLAEALVQETELLFQHLVRENRSLLEFFDADYTFVNERLARHYGIEGVSGDEMRLVRYPSERRRGVLSHGSVLQLTSMSDRTSPVRRGKWVMEVIIGSPPPPPPPNVPAFEASPPAANGRRLTTRERMERHRASPVCSACHNIIDPIGLALDNLDAVGKWRIRENTAPLDTRGQFYDGTPIGTPPELAAVLLKRPIPLIRNFTERLLSYAISRPTEHFDQPVIRAITQAAAADGYRISDLITGVVMSDTFQMRQAQTTAN